MDRPLCKLCRSKHWPSEAHKFAADEQAERSHARSTLEADKPAVERHVEVAPTVHEAIVAVTGVPGTVYPTCGHRRVMTGAERQRRYRAKLEDA